MLDAVYGEARDSEGRVVCGLLDGGDGREGPLSGLRLAEGLTQEMTSRDVLFSLAMANISSHASASNSHTSRPIWIEKGNILLGDQGPVYGRGELPTDQRSAGGL